MRNYYLLKIKLRNEFNKIQKVGNYHSMMPRETLQLSTIRTSEYNINEVKKTQKKIVKSEVRKVKNLKCVIESNHTISDNDIEFFLFATLFLLPPALINKVLDKLQKK